jgi:16S rRNA (cytosine967-C5)-methyltransferase
MTRRNSEAQQVGAREVAVRVLEAVFRKGAFAAATLDLELSRSGLKPADRALATELVYGVSRTRPALQQALAQHAARGMPTNDERVVLHLVVAAYQIAFLDRVPAFAAVDEAVAAVTRLRGQRVAGFCNALLRRFSEADPPKLGACLEGSAPAWLREELIASVGAAHASRLLGLPSGESGVTERTLTATPCVRWVGDEPRPDWLAEAEPGAIYSGALRLVGAGDLRRHPEYTRGCYVIQDEGSMFAASTLGALTGERVLDACAGRGQKASLLAERVGPTGQLWATDKSGKKLEALEREFQRLRLAAPVTRRIDWTGPKAELPTDFDRVLVDAPCSGSGTLRRRPEIMLRLERADVSRLATLAEQVLRASAQHVRPGGVVVFVVCSVLVRECEELVHRVSDVLTPAPFEFQHPLLAGRTCLRLLPDEHATDGFFIASFRRPSKGGAVPHSLGAEEHRDPG